MWTSGIRCARGELLGVISAPDLDASVAQQAAVVQQSKDNVLTAQSTLRLQQATYARVHTLVLHGILSGQDDDAARAAVESAQSNLQAMENAVKGAQEALARERALADFEQVRSPIDGTITARNVEVGNLVSASGAAQGLPAVPAGSTGGPPTGGAQGGELFDVVDLGSLEVFVSVPEQDAPFVQTGQPVQPDLFRVAGRDVQGQGGSEQRLSEPADADAARRGTGPGSPAPVAAGHVRFRARCITGPRIPAS